jgi:coenzyme PQQ precursor peptide PqqA
VPGAGCKEHVMKKSWKAPQVVEKPVGLEVTMYLPAEKA